MLVLNAKEVRLSLLMSEAIAGIRRAFAAIADGVTYSPPRIRIPAIGHDGVTLLMASRIDANNELGLAVKVVSVFNGNAKRGLERVQAAVLLFEPDSGKAIALLEGAALTAIRTAAATAVATDLLARQNSSVLAIMGAGALAPTHIEAICSVRRIERIWVYAPTRSHVEKMISEHLQNFQSVVEIRIANSAQEAVTDADIVCALTTSCTPVFSDSDLKSGAHINAIGSYAPNMQEIPAETVVKAIVAVDDRNGVWLEAGDLIRPFEAGLIQRNHVFADVGELITGRLNISRTDEQITLYKSVGVAVADTVAAKIALDRAIAMNLGVDVTF
jgi:ornithine cyclodeaminase/alanine dehydrogenase-like protein (mu-crystallin family)